MKVWDKKTLIKIVKIIFMASIALWGLLGGIANLMAYQDGYSAVAFTFSMEGAENAPGMWRAVHNPLLIHIGFAFIWLSKFATGFLCSISVVQLWNARNTTAEAFNAAKTIGLVGAGISMFMLFFGFVVISGSYFELWRDLVTMGYEAHVYAFIYFGFIGILALFISQDDK